MARLYAVKVVTVCSGSKYLEVKNNLESNFTRSAWWEFSDCLKRFLWICLLAFVSSGGGRGAFAGFN